MSDNRTLTANFTANSSGFAPAMDAIIQKLKQFSQDLADNQNKVKSLNTEMRGYQTRLRELEAAEKSGKTLTAEQRAEMQSLKDNIARCTTEIGTYRAAQTALRSEISATNRELQEQRNSTEGLSSAFDVLKGTLASGVILQAVNQIADALKICAQYAYQVGSSFEASMSQVEAISGASSQQLDLLTEKAKALGASTRFTATESAQAMNYMAMAGWDAQQMLSGIDGVLSLAAASGSDLATTADIVTDALTAFGLKAEDVGHFSDVLAAASANANTNVSMLGESFRYVAPLAGTLGYTIDETAEALGIMANSGIKASTAGTSMRTMLTNLASGVKITSEAFGELEISAANSDGSMKSLNELLGELREAFSQMTDQEKTMNATTIAGDRAMSGFLALMNAGADDINKLRSAIEGADGAAASMADTMQKNTAGSVTVLNSAIEALGISVYEKFGGELNDFVQNITEAVTDIKDSIDGGELSETFDNLGESIGKVLDDVAEFAKTSLPGIIDGVANTITVVANLKTEITAGVSAFVAFKAAMAIIPLIGKLAVATEGATTAQAAFNAAVAANPVGLLATAIALLVSGMVELSGHLDDCNERMKDFNSEAERAIEKSQEYADKADDLQQIADKYKEIANSEENDAQKKQKLNALQDEFLKKYGNEVDGIQNITDAYAEQGNILEYLNQLRGQYNEQSEREARFALKDAMNAEAEKSFLNFSNELDRTRAVSILKQSGYTSYTADLFDNLYLSGTYEERISALTTLEDYFYKQGDDKNRSTVSSLKKELEAAKAQRDLAYNAYWGYGTRETDSEPTEYMPGGYYTAMYEKEKGEKTAQKQQANREQAEKDREQLLKQYKEEKQLADDMYSVGELSAQEYYIKLAKLRDTYLEKGSHEWYRATSEMMKISDKLGNALGDAVKKDAEQVKSALQDIKQAYSETLAAIDRELEKHDTTRTRDKEDAEYLEKYNALTARLAYDRLDDYSRRSLEKELSVLESERADVLYERNKEDIRSGLQEVYYSAADMAQVAPMGALTTEEWLNGVKAVASALYGEVAKGGVSTVNTNAAKYTNIVINAENKTVEQIKDEVIRAIASDTE